MPVGISVIIPTYNRQHTLENAIFSVLNQTHSHLEIIIIDDGSTDNTKNWLMQNYPQVHYIYQPQQGVSAARNNGISASSYQWIALLDSDDAWAATKIEQQLTALNANPNYKLCHTNEIWYRHGRRVNPMQKHTKKGGWIFQHCLPLCAISPSSVMIHKDIIEEVGLFDTSLPACEDYDLWLRITSRHPVLYIADPLTIKYGGHDDQLSRQHWGMDRFRIKALQKIIASHHLKPADRAAAITILKQKINVYLKGARKRNKFTEISHYEKILADIPN